MWPLQMILLTAKPVIDGKATGQNGLRPCTILMSHCDNCEHEQDMYIRAQGLKRDHPEQPQDHANYGVVQSIKGSRR